MAGFNSQDDSNGGVTRRRFLGQVGLAAVAGGVGDRLTGRAESAEASTSPPVRVKHRKLGKTGLEVSELGFGGHSWAYDRVPDGKGRYRKITQDEATEMIREGLEMGVNFFDSCSPLDESRIPGEALKRLKKRDQAIVCVRPSHKMHGVPQDKAEIYKWTEERLKLWQTDRIDLLLLSNESHITPKSGYWDMSYSIEACDKLKKEGKIRFTGFGSHFTPQWFREAFEKYGKSFDVCSMPYNIRHRMAEEVIPEARKAGLGVITIKPLARGSLLKRSDAGGPGTSAARDMIAFVLANPQVDICLCGVHTLSQMRENFSASSTKLSPEALERLEKRAALSPCPDYPWLEHAWRYA